MEGVDSVGGSVERYAKRGYVTGRELAILSDADRMAMWEFIENSGWEAKNGDAMIAPWLLENG